MSRSYARVCAVIAAGALGVLFLMPALPSAQQAPMHLNPVVAKFAQGKPAFGVSTTDFSIDNANGLARSDADFVRMEMEHAPMDFTTVRTFLLGMIDKAGVLKKGNAQLNVAPFVRIAPYGRDPADWVVKQMLDSGLMGIKFPQIENKAEAVRAIRSMRYPELKGSKILEPAGMRGMGPTNAVWFWGVGQPEYLRHADLWPLNPEGDLVSILMIESAEGVKNVDEIASVPGLSVLYVSQGGDLPRSLGVQPGAPEVEAAVERILKACKTHKVVCGMSADLEDVEQRVKEGWLYLDLGRFGAGVSGRVEATFKKARAAAQ